jgi:hypothetical protein
MKDAVMNEELRENGRTRRIPTNALIGLITFVAVVGLFYSHLFVFPIKLQIGQLVPFTIASPSNAEWVDSAEYARVMSEAEQGWILDPTVADQAVDELNSFFEELRELAKNELPIQSRVQQLGLKYPVDEVVIQKLFTSDPDATTEVQTEAAKLLRQYLATRMDLDKISMLQRNLDRVYVSQAEQIAVWLLRPNIFVYQADNPAELFRDFFTFHMKKGDIIISEGQQVTQQVLDKLAAVTDAMRKQDFLTFIGLTLMFFLQMILWLYYLMRFKKHLWRNTQSLFTMSLLLIVSLAACLVIIRIPFPHFFYAVSLPLIIGSVLFCVIFDSIFALYLFGSLSLLVSWLFNFNTDLLIFNVVGVVAPPVFLSRMSERSSIIKLGFVLAAINCYLIGVVVLVGVQSFSFTPFLIGALSGIAASIIALGSQLFLDLLAVPLTRTKLADLADSNSPLLQRLMLKAPGTYNHSLVMSQMAEEAARAIGADALLAKVGALYHDVGKLVQPQFFAENLQDLEKNPHNKLEPRSSYHIIIQHIEKGVELARKHRLPEEIIKFITTHHGTSVMKYFYHQAAEGEGSSVVDPKEFSYLGPNPVSPETTIVCLADSTEAITRARELSTEQSIREAINEVIEEKLRTGQLADSEVCVSDLSKISDAFAHVLTGIYHSRVKYPDDENKENTDQDDRYSRGDTDIWFDASE